MSVFAVKVFYWCLIAIAVGLCVLAEINRRKSDRQLREIAETQRQAVELLDRIRKDAATLEAARDEIQFGGARQRPRL